MPQQSSLQRDPATPAPSIPAQAAPEEEPRPREAANTKAAGREKPRSPRGASPGNREAARNRSAFRRCCGEGTRGSAKLPTAKGARLGQPVPRQAGSSAAAVSLSGGGEIPLRGVNSPHVLGATKETWKKPFCGRAEPARRLQRSDRPGRCGMQPCHRPGTT